MSDRFYGYSSCGDKIDTIQDPSLLGQARALAVARHNRTNIEKAIVLPADWSLDYRDGQVLLTVPERCANHYRRVYGFVGACNDTDSRGTATPLQFHIVLKLPFFFGKTQNECS